MEANRITFKPLVEKFIHRESVLQLSSEISTSSGLFGQQKREVGPHEASSRWLSSVKTQLLQFPRVAGGSAIWA